MPISRASDFRRLTWIRTWRLFTAKTSFMAETSATSGRLDSLLERWPDKEATGTCGTCLWRKQDVLSTNGHVRTCNKIVSPGAGAAGMNIVAGRPRLAHKSHALRNGAGCAKVVYLDSFIAP